MPIGYESWKCKQAVYGGLLGSQKSSPVKHKHMLFPPACSSLLITEDLWDSWPGRYMLMDTGQPLTAQSVWYHILPGTSVLWPPTSRARLNGVLVQKSMHLGQWNRPRRKLTERIPLYQLMKAVWERGMLGWECCCVCVQCALCSSSESASL
jgi:hypothetical protein